MILISAGVIFLYFSSTAMIAYVGRLLQPKAAVINKNVVNVCHPLIHRYFKGLFPAYLDVVLVAQSEKCHSSVTREMDRARVHVFHKISKTFHTLWLFGKFYYALGRLSPPRASQHHVEDAA